MHRDGKKLEAPNPLAYIARDHLWTSLLPRKIFELARELESETLQN